MKNRGEILESVFGIFKNGSKPWKIVVMFYAWLPLRLQFWLEKQNWHPDNITFKQWLESCGYKSTYPYR